MSGNARAQDGAPLLKGSWEARYAEAAALSRQGNDEAINRFKDLVGRLAGLPPARRAAQDSRLQTILEQSALGLQSHYARRNRLDEMATAPETVLEQLGQDAQSLWRENRARAYWWQGRHEDAVEIARAEVEKLPFDVELRWLLFSILIDAGEVDAADEVKMSLLRQLERLFREAGLDDLDITDARAQLMAKERLAGKVDDDQVSLQFGLLHFLNANVEMERARWEEAADAFAAAARLSDAYSERWHLLYRPLVINNQHRLAQRALNREKTPASQGFWRGLSGFYAGDAQGASAEWRRVIQISLDKVTLAAVGDWILAHYYLDASQAGAESANPPQSGGADSGPESQAALADESRRGLQVALHLLGQPDTRLDPLVLSLAALGWGIAGNKDHLHRNLRHALELLRATRQDNKLSVFNGRFFRDLLPAEEFAEVEQYFHKPRPPHHFP